MPILSIDEIKTALPARARLLGLDLGEKTIGLALALTRADLPVPGR